MGGKCILIINYQDLHRYDDINDILTKKNVTSLFRFIPFNDDKCLNDIKLNTLKNSQEHVSSPLKFNDPYDCELSFNFIDGMDEFLKVGFNREARRDIKHDRKKRERIERRTRFLQDELTGEWNKMKQQIAVCCFSEHVDNFLMWSHYANCYQGICIEYDFQKVSKKNTLFPVLYTNKLTRVRDFMTKEDFRANTSKGLLEAVIRAVLSKSFQWSYEDEWRIVTIVNKPVTSYVNMPVPEKIYIGFKVEDEMRKKIIDICHILGVNEIYDTVISYNEYKLMHRTIK